MRPLSETRRGGKKIGACRMRIGFTSRVYNGNDSVWSRCLPGPTGPFRRKKASAFSGEAVDTKTLRWESTFSNLTYPRSPESRVADSEQPLRPRDK